jgi:phage antirepressor YoqD-like protein
MSSGNLLELVNNARSLAGEKPVRHNDFVSRCTDELEGDHYESFVVQNPNNTSTRYLKLTVDQCKLVAMRESKSVRRSVLEYLNSIQPALPDFSNPAAAARAWAEQYELTAKANEALALAAPKVEFVDQYVEATGSMTFRQVCKLLGANEREFREFLRAKGIMYRLGGEWTAYATHIDAGRFEVKTGTATHNDHAYTSARFTPKGVEWVSALWRKEAA